jgi:predicted RNase H-like nuclease (RuvC/YqgF family)
MNSTTKTALLAKAQEMLKDQIKDIQRQLSELQESSEVEEKSSAGDKFETHQEMLHQTRDILEKRLSSSRVMLAQLNAVPVKELQKVDEGALIQVPMGKIWVSIPMGKVVLDGVDYQLVSRDSPLISALWELKKGQSADFRGKQIEVKDLV